MSSIWVALAVYFFCFARWMEASTTVTIVTTSSTTTTTTKTSPGDSSTLSASQKCPAVTSGSVTQATESLQEKYLHLSVDPVTIIEGSTSQLSVNCTFWAMPEVQVSRIGIIEIVRLQDVNSSFGLEKQEMASVVAGNKNEPVAKGNLIVTRQVNQSGLSYLNLTISSPTSNDEGLYRCTVVGADTHKEPFLAQAIKSVGRYGSEKLAPTPSLKTTGLSDVSAKLKKQIETTQLAFDNISKKVAILENFKTNANSRLANIKETLAQLNINGKRAQYFISTVEFSDFDLAQATCELFGGFLAEAESSEELQLFTSFAAGIFGVKGEVSRVGVVDGVLIGGTYDEEEHKWVTRFNVDNTHYFHWSDGYPKTDSTKKCVVLFRDADWGMTNQACTHENSNIRFMCEIPHRK